MTRTTTTARLRAVRIAAMITLLAGLAWQGVAAAQTDDLPAPSDPTVLAAAADPWVDKPLRLTILPQSFQVLTGTITLKSDHTVKLQGAEGVAALIPNPAAKLPDIVLRFGSCTWKNGSDTYENGNPKSVKCNLTRDNDSRDAYSLTIEVVETPGLGRPVLVGVFYLAVAGSAPVLDPAFVAGVVHIEQ